MKITKGLDVEDVQPKEKKEKNPNLKKFAQSFFIQKLQQERLKPDYQPELFSLSFLKDHKITDKENNPLAIYKSDYNKFVKYLKTTFGAKDLKSYSTEQIVEALSKSGVQVVKYFTAENLQKYALDIDRFNKDKDLVTEGKVAAVKKGHQNCLVMLQNGNVYFIPKSRAVVGNIDSLIKVDGEEVKQSKSETTGALGANHSSLSNGLMVKFAGSFVYDEKASRWVIENTSGHYGTNVFQIRGFLQSLKEKGLELETFSVKTWVPEDPKNPGIHESDYRIAVENAAEFLSRTNKNMETLQSSSSFTQSP